MTMYGADSDELRRLAAEMTQAAEELDSNQNLMSKTLFNISWLGDIASNFAEKWTGVSVPRMNLSTNFLREAAECLDRQAKEQDEASTADGGGAGGACKTENLNLKPGEKRKGDCTQDGPQVTGTWDAPTGDAEARGRAVIDRALRDTNDETVIAKDEFQIIELENGKYIVVVPGVTDLSAWKDWAGDGFSGDSPLDWDPTHRSVRDMDMAAVASAGNTDIRENLYAQYVRDQMSQYIPPGSDVMMVGHSYGSDTVMDLANDPSFNGGPYGYNVTHVVAAAYNTDGQWDGIPASTEVLSLQNTGDAVVGMEHLTEGISEAKYGVGQVRDGIGSLNPGKIGSGIKDVVIGTGKTVLDIPTRGGVSALDAIPRTTNHGDGQNNITFWGGTGGDFGHEPWRYAEYVSRTDNGAVQDFAQSVSDSGYDVEGTRVVYDVTVDS